MNAIIIQARVSSSRFPNKIFSEIDGEAALFHVIDECLLSDSDLLLGKDYWAQFPDPFPEWGEAA